jgi:hypothetical protein
MIPAQRFQDYSTSHDFQFPHLVRGSVALVDGSATDIFPLVPQKCVVRGIVRGSHLATKQGPVCQPPSSAKRMLLLLL